MKARKPIRSQMGWSTADKIVVRGHDLPKELIGHIDLGGMAFLEIMGRLPTAPEADMFNALLVTLVEHGMTPQAIATRMISAAAPEALQAAVAAGLCGVGSVFAGGSEQCAKILQEALKDRPVADDLDQIATDIVESYVARKAVIPGIGHPVHKPIDPRTPVLFAIAERNGFRGRVTDQRHRRHRCGVVRTWLLVADLSRHRGDLACRGTCRSYRRRNAKSDCARNLGADRSRNLRKQRLSREGSTGGKR
jgi:hypothetical protein